MWKMNSFHCKQEYASLKQNLYRIVLIFPGQPFRSQFCTVPSSMDWTSRCNKIDAVRLYASHRLSLLLLKGACTRPQLWKYINSFETYGVGSSISSLSLPLPLGVNLIGRGGFGLRLKIFWVFFQFKIQTIIRGERQTNLLIKFRHIKKKNSIYEKNFNSHFCYPNPMS